MATITTITVVVPAAGCGARSGLDGNKILAPLRGQTVLAQALASLSAARLEMLDCHLLEWVICARVQEFNLIRTALVQPGFANLKLVEGGATRQESVFAGVRSSKGDLVLVHDAARPCVGAELVERVVASALANGAAIAALPVSDTVKQARADSGFISQTLDRSTIWLAQTPQVFRRTLLLESLESAAREGFLGTDCASLLERKGHQVALVEGSEANIKVTYPMDLERAASIMQTRGS